MKITIEMSQVAECSVEQCAYNLASLCHAKAITIGDPAAPACDTFVEAPVHAKGVKIRAGVGACKMTGCVHNADFECEADGVEVGFEGGEAHCLTYTARL